MKEIVIGFIIALVASSILADSGQLISPNGWTFANSAGPDLLEEVNAGTFQGEVLDSQLPVLVEFYTQECVHCQAMKPILTQMASEAQGYLRVVKVDAQANPALSERYKVEGVPAYVLFKDGKTIYGEKGEMTKAELEKWVKQELDMPVG